MGQHTADPGVFIRSVSARGHLGGLSESVSRIVDLIDAAGWDHIVVETVGAGQSETEIVGLADVNVVINAPGLGDEVQAMKAGILEIADVLVVNKADSPLAMESGFLARQIAPVEVPERRGTRLFAEDEFPRPQTTLEKLQALKPVFREGGRVTAGNSSGMTDGAAFIVVADGDSAAEAGLAPRARLLDWEVVGVPPRIMGCGPVPAIARLLERRGMKVDDIDYFEINEAFAVVNLHTESELGISRDRTNLYGGGISIGHPPGATGVRMALTAIDHLHDTGGRYAILSMCLGAGQGMAVLIENLAL